MQPKSIKLNGKKCYLILQISQLKYGSKNIKQKSKRFARYERQVRLNTAPQQNKMQ